MNKKIRKYKRHNHDKRYRFICDNSESPIHDIIEWCEENLGRSRRNTWRCSNGGVVYISPPDIIMAFKLRWV